MSPISSDQRRHAERQSDWRQRRNGWGPDGTRERGCSESGESHASARQVELDRQRPHSGLDARPVHRCAEVIDLLTSTSVVNVLKMTGKIVLVDDTSQSR
jgi:hypothetical protein